MNTNTSIPESVKFSEEVDDELRAELMEEFNTLSIIYGKPSVHFIAPEYQVTFVKMPEEHPLGSDVASISGSAVLRTNVVENEAVPSAPVTDPGAAGGFADVDLLGFGGPSEPASPAPPPAAPVAASAQISLSPQVALSGEEYQNTWGAISDGESEVRIVPLPSLPSSADQVESALARYGIMTMASGELSNEFKFFFYAQDSISGNLFLVQANLEKTADPTLVVTVKVSGGGAAQQPVDQLIEVMNAALSS